MKKFFSLFLSLSITLFCIPIVNSKALEINELKDGDTSITQNVIDVGNDYAKRMEEKSKIMRMDEEVQTLTSSTVVIPYDTLKVAHGGFVEPGASLQRNCTWSIEVGKSIGNTGISLTLGISGSKSISKNGPLSTDRLANNVKATHRSFFAIGKGKVVKYNYKVTSKYSGTFIRNETATLAADVTTLECSQ